VLPYCIFNVLLGAVVQFCNQHKIRISFEPEGHALMSLIVSFLVITKVQVAYDRYMQARTHLGEALFVCRDLQQHVMVFGRASSGIQVKRSRDSGSNRNLSTHGDASQSWDAAQWHSDIKTLTIKMLTVTIKVLKASSRLMNAMLVSSFCRVLLSFACRPLPWSPIFSWQNEDQALRVVRGKMHAKHSPDDPMTYVLLLRSKIYSADSSSDYQVLEKLRLLDFLTRYVDAYGNLLKLA
jgi:hypothetical protein